MLTQAKWRTLAWRKGTKGPLKARFAAVRVRVADGPPQRIGDKGMQHMPGERSLARRRAARLRRAEILSRQPPCRRRSQNAGRHDQSALDLRAGSPAAQGRTRPRPLRRPLMARASSPCADDHDRLRLPPASSPRRRERGKKESPGARLSRRSRPYEKPSFSPWRALHPTDARTAACKSADRSNKSAKVVLVQSLTEYSGRKLSGRIAYVRSSRPKSRRSLPAACAASVTLPRVERMISSR